MKITNEQLEYRNIDLEVLCYVMAHDLKAPLINLHSLLEILINREVLNPDSEPITEKMVHVVDQLF